MSKNQVFVAAGPNGAKSTFGAGLLHHTEKTNLSVSSNILGDEEDYDDRVVDLMWGQMKYPDQTKNGYVVTHEIGAGSYRIPTTEVKMVDLPGEQQRRLLNPDNDIGLIKKIRRGDVDSKEDVIETFESDIYPKFLRGRSPDTVENWRKTFLYYYYRADRVIFLVNLHKLVYQSQGPDDVTLAFDKKMIEHAVDNFSDVAVVPTAVDIIDYDPDDRPDPGMMDKLVRSLITPEQVDRALFDAIDEFVDFGVDRRAANVINYAKKDPEVDFFGVAVPDKNDDTGNLKSDGDSGFVVQGFDQILEWLK